MLTKFAQLVAVTGLFLSGPAIGQTLATNSGPAEIPPASFTGSQYVDSAGCVFIRAGVDGGVTWVPRVTRDRKMVCGREPSLKNVVAQTAPATRKVPAATATAAPTQQANLVRKPVAPKTVTYETAAQNGVTPYTRLVPKHVYLRRQNTRNVSVPKGYRRVWEDDRLNPYRAEHNLAGTAASQLIWTDTVPRRLVDPTVGRDLTAKVALVYPYTDIVTQRRELGEVTLLRKNGKVYKRIVRNDASATRAPTYSSRSAPRAEDVADQGR